MTPVPEKLLNITPLRAYRFLVKVDYLSEFLASSVLMKFVPDENTYYLKVTYIDTIEDGPTFDRFEREKKPFEVELDFLDPEGNVVREYRFVDVEIQKVETELSYDSEELIRRTFFLKAGGYKPQPE